MSWCKSVPCQIWSPDFGHLELQNKMILKRTDLLKETGQHVKFFVTFATKVPYLTFCDNVWYRKWIERGEIKRKWGNEESEISPFFHSLHFLTSRMQGCSKLCNPVILYSQSFSIPSTMRAILHQLSVDSGHIHLIHRLIRSHYHIHVPLYFPFQFPAP